MIEKAVIWDFDNVLFKNPNNDYTDDILTISNNITKMITLTRYNISFCETFNDNILLTGRGNFQKDIIKKLLKENGYKFVYYIFYNKEREQFPAYNKKIDFREFYIDYWKWKMDNILKICNEYNGNVLVIDDDEVLNLMCDKLKIQHIKFDVRQVTEDYGEGRWT